MTCNAIISVIVTVCIFTTVTNSQSLTAWQPIRVKIDTTAFDSACATVGQQVPNYQTNQMTACTAENIITADAKAKAVEVMNLGLKYFTDGSLLVNRRTAPIPLPPSCLNFQFPSADVTNGVAGYDLVLYAIFQPGTTGDNMEAPMSAITCSDDEHSRSIVGLILLNPSNFLRTYSDITYSIEAAHVAHEVFHVLGFNSKKLSSGMFEDDLTTVRRSIAPRVFYGQPTTILTTPSVLIAAKDYFGCQTLTGIPLENDGGTKSAGSHWEKRVLGTEMMVASQVTADIPVFSELSFAAMRDFGYYRVTYETCHIYFNRDGTKVSNPLRWGRGAGCNFLNDKCNNADLASRPEYCFTVNQAACTIDFRSQGQCSVSVYPAPLPIQYQYFPDPNKGGANQFADYCPSIETFANRVCSQSSSHTDAPSLIQQLDDATGQVFTANSRCFQSTASLVGNTASNEVVAQDNGLRCYESKCVNNGKQVRIKLSATQSVDCPADGSGTVITITGNQFQGTITCPSSASFCSSEIVDSASLTAYTVTSPSRVSAAPGRITTFTRVASPDNGISWKVSTVAPPKIGSLVLPIDGSLVISYTAPLSSTATEDVFTVKYCNALSCVTDTIQVNLGSPCLSSDDPIYDTLSNYDGQATFPTLVCQWNQDGQIPAGKICTTNTQCLSGNCAGNVCSAPKCTTQTCTAQPATACRLSGCVPSLGCNPAVPNTPTLSCDDGDATTSDDTCQYGICIGNHPIAATGPSTQAVYMRMSTYFPILYEDSDIASGLQMPLFKITSQPSIGSIALIEPSGIRTGIVVYTPPITDPQSGTTTTFTWTVTDGVSTATYTTTLAFTATFDGIVPKDAVYELHRGTVLSAQVATERSTPVTAGMTTIWRIKTAPTLGSVSVSSSGVFTYTPRNEVTDNEDFFLVQVFQGTPPQPGKTTDWMLYPFARIRVYIRRFICEANCYSSDKWKTTQLVPRIWDTTHDTVRLKWENNGVTIESDGYIGDHGQRFGTFEEVKYNKDGVHDELISSKLPASTSFDPKCLDSKTWLDKFNSPSDNICTSLSPTTVGLNYGSLCESSPFMAPTSRWQLRLKGCSYTLTGRYLLRDLTTLTLPTSNNAKLWAQKFLGGVQVAFNTVFYNTAIQPNSWTDANRGWDEVNHKYLLSMTLSYEVSVPVGISAYFVDCYTVNSDGSISIDQVCYCDATNPEDEIARRLCLCQVLTPELQSICLCIYQEYCPPPSPAPIPRDQTCVMKKAYPDDGLGDACTYVLKTVPINSLHKEKYHALASCGVSCPPNGGAVCTCINGYVASGYDCNTAVYICGNMYGLSGLLTERPSNMKALQYHSVIVPTNCENFCGTVTCKMCFTPDNCFDVTTEQCNRLTSYSLQGSFSGTMALCRASPTKVDSALWDNNQAFTQIDMSTLCEQKAQRTFSPSDVASIYFDIPDLEPKYVKPISVKVTFTDPIDGLKTVTFRSEADGLIDVSATYPWFNYKEIPVDTIQGLWPTDAKDFGFMFTPGRLNANLKMTIAVTLEITQGTNNNKRFHTLADSSATSQRSEFTKEITIVPPRPVTAPIDASRLGYVIRGENNSVAATEWQNSINNNNGATQSSSSSTTLVVLAAVLGSVLALSVIGAGVVFFIVKKNRAGKGAPRRLPSNADTTVTTE